MARTVGFPFPKSSPLGGRSDVPLSISVFLAPDGSPPAGFRQVPTFDRFFEAVNGMRPETSQPLPPAVLRRLKSDYSRAALGKTTPLAAYSRLSGISPDRLVDQQLDSSTGYDVFTNPATAGDIVNRSSYAVYQQANAAIGRYYNAVATDVVPTDVGVRNFFANFADTKLQSHPRRWINDLAVGFRALLALTFDASPLYSSFGIGYSDVANPFVGKRSADQTGPEIYVGQEFQVNNIPLPSDGVLTVEPPTNPPPTPPDYLENGFFKLNEPTVIRRGPYVTTPPAGSYQWNGQIIEPGAVVRFDPASSTSDTISAGSMATHGRFLTRSSRIDVNGGLQPLSDLPGLANRVLPRRFATYIALGGGIDNVVGSRSADVIVGPTTAGLTADQALEFSGRLTVNAGPGNDVVEPGRGASLLELGAGSDRVVIGEGDLFGKATLLDFKGTSDRDRLVIDPSLTASGFGTPTLIVRDAAGNAKTIMLTGTSDANWSRSFVLDAPEGSTRAD